MTESDDQLQELNIDGVIYRTKFTKKYQNNRAWEYPDMKKILSYIPGTVIKFYKKENETAKAGEPIMLFEAMKMQTKVIMPYDGVIKKFCVSIGERYPKEHILVEIE